MEFSQFYGKKQLSYYNLQGYINPDNSRNQAISLVLNISIIARSRQMLGFGMSWSPLSETKAGVVTYTTAPSRHNTNLIIRIDTNELNYNTWYVMLNLTSDVGDFFILISECRKGQFMHCGDFF